MMSGESESSLESLVIRALLEFSSINYSNSMTASAESSIQELVERVTVETGADENCTICLEALEVESQVSRMPCRHRFHAHCIQTWLKQRQSCPICRFQITTE